MLSARLLWLTAPSSLYVSGQSERTPWAERLFVQDFIRQAAHSAQCHIDLATQGHTHTHFLCSLPQAWSLEALIDMCFSLPCCGQNWITFEEFVLKQGFYILPKLFSNIVCHHIIGWFLTWESSKDFCVFSNIARIARTDLHPLSCYHIG